jgi:hypothetical protein
MFIYLLLSVTTFVLFRINYGLRKMVGDDLTWMVAIALYFPLSWSILIYIYVGDLYNRVRNK